MALLVACALGSSGCDKLFSLDEIQPGKDAALEDSAADGDVDAASTHDEDGDGVYDIADDCPGLSDPAQLDGDGDEIGDVCDPHPTVAGDHIVAAAYFVGNAAPWTVETPALWAQTADSLDTVGAVTSAQLTFSVLGTTPTLEIGADLVALGACNTTTPCKLEARLDFPSQTANCDAKGTSTSLNTLEISNVGHGTAPGLTTPVVAGGRISIQYRRDMGADSCTINGDPVTISADVRATTLVQAHVVVKEASVALRYVLLYDVQ